MSTKHDPTPATEIAFILDRSGSMGAHTEAAIAGFNEFLREQQAVEGMARLTLVLFDDRYEVPVDNIPVSEVVTLDTTTYVPRGSTALLDAMGRTIGRLKKRMKKLPKEKRPRVIVAVFTDGLENSSARYGWQDIAGKIRRRRERDGWEFLFLAAGQDAIATASQMSIHAANAATASAGEKGVRGAQRAMNRKIRALREEEPGAADTMAPMEEILREEEDRED